MSTVTPQHPASSMEPPGLYRITVEEYERICDLLDDPRVELIDGHLVKKMTKKPEHSWSTKQVLKGLDRLLPSGWTWRTEQPLRLPPHDEPEPDLAIVRGTDDDYMHRLPGPADVALVVEVSESTLNTDRREKLSGYAHAAIPVYWILNLIDQRVEVYTDPVNDRYASRQDYQVGQLIPVEIHGDLVGELSVDQLLPQ